MRRNTIFSSLQLALSFVGAGIAGLLYWAHQANVDLPCSTGSGCELVAASRWSHIGGVPVSLIGFFGYSVLAILSVAKLNAQAPSIARIRGVMLLVAAGGAGYSWYLQYVSHVFIGAICAYCMTSAINMTLLLVALIAEQTRGKPESVVPA